MPYIEQDKRKLLDSAWEPTHSPSFKPVTAGELNYRITDCIMSYLGVELSYEKINEVIGVLECAKMELYRRVAVPYENVKCDLNGDVYYP